MTNRVTSRQDVLALLEEGLDLAEAADRLGVPRGLAYLVVTGRPADGSDTGDDVADEGAGGGPLRTVAFDGATQHLVNPHVDTPTRKEEIITWLQRRAATDAQMRHAADVRGVEPPPEREVPADPLVTDELTRQHNRIHYLTKQLQALPGHSEHGSRLKVARRKAVAEALAPRIAAHDAAERAVLWPLVRDVLPDGADWHERSAALGVPELASRLAGCDPDTAEFDELAEQLIRQARRHDALAAELFGRLTERVGADRLRELGARVRGAGEPEQRTGVHK